MNSELIYLAGFIFYMFMGCGVINTSREWMFLHNRIGEVLGVVFWPAIILVSSAKYFFDKGDKQQ